MVTILSGLTDGSFPSVNSWVVENQTPIEINYQSPTAGEVDE